MNSNGKNGKIIFLAATDFYMYFPVAGHRKIQSFNEILAFPVRRYDRDLGRTMIHSRHPWNDLQSQIFGYGFPRLSVGHLQLHYIPAGRDCIRKKFGLDDKSAMFSNDFLAGKSHEAYTQQYQRKTFQESIYMIKSHVHTSFSVAAWVS
jgi:hypothetical protein